ncbi:hypothetical protein I6F11_22290 [Ensifer sp. NBAIM29]|nr:hypothetical protein [Ensifer sp. NBAIM29]
MKARRRVEEWIRRFNKGDAIALAELYHENAMSLMVDAAPRHRARGNPKDFSTKSRDCGDDLHSGDHPRKKISA